jgi:hypothetical protein
MKKATVYLILLLIMGLAQQPVSASKFLNPKSPGYEADAVYDDDVFLSAFQAKFDSKVYGDLFSFCYEMVQSDSVIGNFMAFAYSVQNLGPVTGSYRAFGREVSCNGEIGRNLLLFGQTVDIGPQAHVVRNADLAGENIMFLGAVDGTVSINAKNAVVSGKIGGDLDFRGDSLTINPNTVIGGNLKYTSPNRVSIGQGAVITGQVDWKKEDTIKPEEKKDEGNFWTAITWIISLRGYVIFSMFLWVFILVASLLPFPSVLVSIIFWFALLVSGNILIAIYKSRARATERILRERFFPSMGLGFIIFFMAPIVVVILFMTVLASPLGMILLMLFGIAIFAGGIYAGLFIGRRLCGMFGTGGANTPGYLCFTIGTTLLMIISLLPVLGYLVIVLMLMAGLGGLVQSFKTQVQEKAITSEQ